MVPSYGVVAAGGKGDNATECSHYVRAELGTQDREDSMQEDTQSCQSFQWCHGGSSSYAESSQDFRPGFSWTGSSLATRPAWSNKGCCCYLLFLEFASC